MAEELHEVFLDTLVMQTVNLQMLRRHPEESRAAAFLTELGYEQKLDYIQDTLEKQINPNLMPDGIFYVITPDEGFIYKKEGAAIDQLSESDKIDYKSGSLADIVRTLEEAHANHLKNSIAINVIFYNAQSVKNFNKMIEGIGFHLLAQMGLKRLDDTREIRYHSYTHGQI